MKKPFFIVALVLTLLIAACGGGGTGDNGGGGTTPTYTVGGSTSPSSPLNGTIVLQINGGNDQLYLSANGGTGSVTFTFANAIANGAAYSVTIKSQPSNQTCTITNGAGTVVNANVTNILVSCTSLISTQIVGGNVSGLDKGNSVVLQNGGQEVTVSYTADNTSVPFAFATKVATGSVYAVSVKTQPLGLACSVSGGSGSITSADITNVMVSCVSAPVAMPTLADYGVTPKTWWYDLEQTGSLKQGEALTIMADGSMFFLSENYPSVTSFFNDEQSVFMRQPCVIFPLYVGKSGSCSRTIIHNRVSADVMEDWLVESVVEVTLFGQSYKAYKIIDTYTTSGTTFGNGVITKYYSPDLKVFIKMETVRSTGINTQIILSFVP